MKRNIVTDIIVDFTHPPIPRRDFDWCAYYEGDEERGDYGWGSTERLALYDLKSKTSRWYEFMHSIEDLREGCIVVGHTPNRFVLGIEIICFAAWEYLCRLFSPRF